MAVCRVVDWEGEGGASGLEGDLVGDFEGDLVGDLAARGCDCGRGGGVDSRGVVGRSGAASSSCCVMVWFSMSAWSCASSARDWERSCCCEDFLGEFVSSGSSCNGCDDFRRGAKSLSASCQDGCSAFPPCRRNLSTGSLLNSSCCLTGLPLVLLTGLLLLASFRFCSSFGRGFESG